MARVQVARVQILSPPRYTLFGFTRSGFANRIELLRDVGSESAPAALRSLKALQDELGNWHDNLELATVTARVLGKPQFLAQYLRTAALMLRRMDRDNRRHLSRIRQLLPSQHFEGSLSSPDDPIALCCRQAPNAATRAMS